MPARENRFVVHRPLGEWSPRDHCKVIVLRTLAVVVRGRWVAIARPETTPQVNSMDVLT